MESFECTICYDKFTDAHETLCCNQCYCKKCLFEWMEKSKTCPSCRAPINRRKISKNIPIQRVVDNFPVLCPNTHLGCTAAPTKGDLNNHLAKSCDFVEVPCTLKCTFKVVKANISHHIASECANRVVQCPSCTKSVVASALEAHKKRDCPKKRYYCPFCRVVFLRETMKHHFDVECTKIELSCPFAVLGCAFKGQRTEYDEHLIAFSEFHIDLAANQSLIPAFNDHSSNNEKKMTVSE